MVRERYPENDAPPLLLSRLGQNNKDLLAELKARFGTLLGAIKAAGEDRLRIVDERVGPWQQCLSLNKILCPSGSSHDTMGYGKAPQTPPRSESVG